MTKSILFTFPSVPHPLFSACSSSTTQPSVCANKLVLNHTASLSLISTSLPPIVSLAHSRQAPSPPFHWKLSCQGYNAVEVSLHTHTHTRTYTHTEAKMHTCNNVNGGEQLKSIWCCLLGLGDYNMGSFVLCMWPFLLVPVCVGSLTPFCLLRVLCPFSVSFSPPGLYSSCLPHLEWLSSSCLTRKCLPITSVNTFLFYFPHPFLL